MTADERLALRVAREKHGWSQKALASLIPSRMGYGRKLTGAAINAFENGTRNPAPVTLDAWRAALADTLIPTFVSPPRC